MACFSTIGTLETPFAEDVAACASAGCRALDVWLTKLEKHLDAASLSDTRRLLEDKDVMLAAASYQGGLLLSQGEQRRAHYDHFRRRLDLCQQLAIPVLVVAPDDAVADVAAISRAAASLGEAARWAAGFNVRLALEFRGRSSWCASLDTAYALAAQSGEANVGLNLDLFHFYTGPSKFEDLQLLTPANLAFVQIADVAGVLP